jgi:hypothetical protein
MVQSRGRAVLHVVGLFVVLSASAHAQQVADPEFKPRIEKPAFAEGKGPVVLLDEAHYNFHTASGRYQTFADLLRRDGYVVVESKNLFRKESLSLGKILVIANALSKRNAQDWNPPIDHSFTDEEVKAVRTWVENDGSPLLIVDHFPMPATISPLAEAFGVRFYNGYAVDPQSHGPIVFSRAENSLMDHPITRGRNEKERINSVATFTGSAFQIARGDPILTFVRSDAFTYTPKAFGSPPDANTPRTPIKGWLQGATLTAGKGRIAVFGEAAMFSAQLAGPDKVPMGMNATIAAQNPQFLLNVMHWLSGVLDK